jgi:hypothetical protein
VLLLNVEVGSLVVGSDGTAAEAVLVLSGGEADCGGLASARAGLGYGLDCTVGVGVQKSARWNIPGGSFRTASRMCFCAGFSLRQRTFPQSY